MAGKRASLPTLEAMSETSITGFVTLFFRYRRQHLNTERRVWLDLLSRFTSTISYRSCSRPLPGDFKPPSKMLTLMDEISKLPKQKKIGPSPEKKRKPLEQEDAKDDDENVLSHSQDPGRLPRTLSPSCGRSNLRGPHAASQIGPPTRII